jgi:hypothetical protein
VSYFKHVQERVAYRQGQQGKGVKAALPISITDDFFKQKEDSHIRTILHELSHHAANTRDEENFLGIPLYGPLTTWAKLNGKADNNADNYAYFLESFA